MKEITIKIIYDNCKEKSDLQEGWGFSALIETKDRKILFDTGNDRNAFFSNSENMGIYLPKGFPLKKVPKNLQVQIVTDFIKIEENVFSLVLKGGLFLYEQS